MESAPTLDASVRFSVFDHFVRKGDPPTVEQLMAGLGKSRDQIEACLDRLDTARHLKVLPGTHRILMAFPFSAIATPYQVHLEDGRKYFANCAWDAIAFHSMLQVPIRIESYCHHCGRAVRVDVPAGLAVTQGENAPVVYLGLPAARWWNDIIATCANTMLFFANSDHLKSWREGHRGADGVELPLRTVAELSAPLYRERLTMGFVRPSRERLIQLFQDLGLTGDFWNL